MQSTEQFTVKPATSGRPRSMLWPAVLVFSLAGVLLIVALVAGEILRIRPHALGMQFEIVAAALGLGLAVAIGVGALVRGRLDPFELPTWISLNIYIQVVLNVWLLQRDRIPEVPWLVSQPGPKMAGAVVLIAVGLAALWLGYGLASWLLRSSARPRPRPQRQIRLQTTGVIWFVTWLASAALTLMGVKGYLAAGMGSSASWTNYYYLIEVVNAAAVSALAIHHFRRPTALGWLWLALVLSSAIALALIGGRKTFALDLLWVAIYVYYARHRIPWRALALGALAVIVFLPVVNNYRLRLHALDQGTGVDAAARPQALAGALQETWSDPWSSLFESTEDAFERRQGTLLDITASAMTLHPAVIPYVGEDIAQYLLHQVIPRVVWPDKPTTFPDLIDYTSIYFGVYREFARSDLGLFADAYRAGGWGFEVLFLAAAGVLAAWLYQRGPRRGDSAGTVFYIVILTRVIIYETDMITLLLHLIQYGPILWVLVEFVIFAPLRAHAPNLQHSQRQQGLHPEGDAA